MRSSAVCLSYAAAMGLVGWTVFSIVSRVSVPGPAPSTEAPATVSSTHRDPRPWVRRRSGRGLAVGAAASGALGWGMALGTIVARAGECPAPDGCVHTIFALSIPRALANGLALGLAIPAGVRAGRYDAAWRSSPASDRRSRAFVAAGAAALAIGTAGWVSAWAMRLTVAPRCGRDPCFNGVTAGVQTGAAFATTGAGLLAYGLAHRASTREPQPGRARALQLMPSFQAGHSGLTLAGRF